MGMFDTVYVAEPLLRTAIEKENLIFEPHEGYCDFQTKDLDNCLLHFYIEEDGSFLEEEQDYKWIEPPKDKNLKFPANLGYQEPVGEARYIERNKTCYLDFYDFYHTDEERVYVTFTAHLKEGKLVEPIAVKSIERTNLKEEQENLKVTREAWDKVRVSREWILADYISVFTFKVSKILRHVENYCMKLRETARKKHGLDY